MHHIGGWGKMVRDRIAPTLGHRLASHAHYLKEGGFLGKSRNGSQLGLLIGVLLSKQVSGIR